MYPNNTYAFFPTCLRKAVARVPVFVISPVVINILIGFKSIISMFSCSVLFNVFSVMEEELIYKHHQWWLRVIARGNNAHWVNHLNFYYWQQINHLKNKVYNRKEQQGDL